MISTTQSFDYSAENALKALEGAYFDVEAERASRLMIPMLSVEIDALSDVAHAVRARLVRSFEALVAEPADPWTRYEQLKRAADLFGPDAPVVGLIGGALSADQARLASAEAA